MGCAGVACLAGLAPSAPGPVVPKGEEAGDGRRVEVENSVSAATVMDMRGAWPPMLYLQCSDKTQSAMAPRRMRARGGGRWKEVGSSLVTTWGDKKGNQRVD